MLIVMLDSMLIVMLVCSLCHDLNHKPPTS